MEEIDRKKIDQQYWDGRAENYLRAERHLFDTRFNGNRPSGVVVNWRDKRYIGNLRPLLPRDGIYVFDKQKGMSIDRLIDAVLTKDPGRMRIELPSEEDLNSTDFHILRIVDGKPYCLTSEQHNYVTRRLAEIEERALNPKIEHGKRGL